MKRLAVAALILFTCSLLAQTAEQPLNIEFIKIAPGEFMMGCSVGDIDCNEIADCCRVELVNHCGCSFGMKWLIQRWPVHRWLTSGFDGKKSLLNMGTPSPYPWDLALYRQNVWRRAWAAHAAPRHSGRWVGAPVASLRSRTLRPGEVSINHPAWESQKKLA